MTCPICAAPSTQLLCALCQGVLDRMTGAIPGGLVTPYLFHYARHQAAFRKLRDSA